MTIAIGLHTIDLGIVIAADTQETGGHLKVEQSKIVTGGTVGIATTGQQPEVSTRLLVLVMVDTWTR